MKKAILKTSLTGIATVLLAQSAVTRAYAQAVSIDPATTYQVIRGFGGHNGPGWIPDLTAVQVDTAFGTGAGQIGLSIMRMRIDSSNSQWQKQVPTAQLARAQGVTLFATPWSPPASMKTNQNVIGGKLNPQYYPNYATHLLNFAAYMQSSGAPLYAISIQNEPDLSTTYESCVWSSDEFVSFLNTQGSRFSGLKVMLPEASKFTKTLSDPMLNDATSVALFDIVAGHLYGASPSDYPLARSKGKELWMTEHYTDTTDANDWSKALPVAVEIHKSMVSNYSAYNWWYIRRSYGLITEDGNVSKRGYVMSQYAKYIRPGFVRIGATEKPYTDVMVSAFKDSDGNLVTVAVNNGSLQRRIDFTFGQQAPGLLSKYSTSATASNVYGGDLTVVGGAASATIEPLSVTTFVSKQSWVDATANVKMVQSGLTVNRFTGQFAGTVSFTNTSGVPIAAGTQFVLEGLPASVTVVNRSGDRGGNPFIALPSAIVPGATVVVNTVFNNPSKVTIGYMAKLYRLTYQ
jgi:O-glycosyl hydrolase